MEKKQIKVGDKFYIMENNKVCEYECEAIKVEFKKENTHGFISEIRAANINQCFSTKEELLASL